MSTMRRSSRRLTITGSSVFVANTPVVQPVIRENLSSSDGSPQWISAEEAFTFKTPKVSRMTRRTTLTHQNIFREEDETGLTAEADFKMPGSFFVPVSPPGVKTRSRRSSIFVPKTETVFTNITSNKLGANVKAENTKRKVVESKDENISIKKTKKAIQKTDEKVQLYGKKPLSTTNSLKRSKQTRPVNNTDKTLTLRIENLQPDTNNSMESQNNTKKPRKSIPRPVFFSVQEQAENDSTHILDTKTNETNTVGNENVLQMMDNEDNVGRNVTHEEIIKVKSKTPKAGLNYSSSNINMVEKSNEQSEEKISIISEKVVSKTPLAVSKTPLAVSKTPLAKTASQYESKSVKRLTSHNDTDEIDRVVNKMFSPPRSNSKSKQKMNSPRITKFNSSPARVALLKEAVVSKHSSGKSVTKIKSTPNTPSRAAPKAKKILGVTTPMISAQNKERQDEKNENVDEVCQICDEPPVAEVEDDDDNTSFRIEDEQNCTLSHTSHSQWCTIL